MTLTHNTLKQFNVWAVQEELANKFQHKELDYRLKVLRDQYINSLILEKTQNDSNNLSNPVLKSKKVRCSIL